MLTLAIITLVLLATFLFAAWPLLALPRVRAAAQVAGGSCCVSGGAGIMGLLTAGLIALPGVDSRPLAAQEKASESAAAATTSAADSKPAQIIEGQEPTINLEEGDAEKAKPADDIKIEALPDDSFRIPPGRPEWINSGKPVSLNGPVHTIYVTSGPYKLTRDAERHLDEALKRATDEYIGDQLGSPLAAKFVFYDVRQIRDRFVKDTYEETVEYADPIGPMDEYHAVLEFDQEFRNEIHNHWVGRIAESRLYQVGLFAGGALLLLSSVFGYFRADNATRGYYTGRLQFMTAAAILAIIAGVVASAFGFTWL